MDAEIVALIAIVALALGALIGWLIGNRQAAGERSTAQMLRLQRDELVIERDAIRERFDESERLRSALEADTRNFETRLADLQKSRQEMTNQFREVADQLLGDARKKFLEQAQEKFTEAEQTSSTKLELLLQPMKETLKRYEADLRQLENDRKGAYQSLTDQIGFLREGQERVASEALRLRTALRSSTGDVGRWGEDQCRNVLERAGLQEGIDFEEQLSTDAAGDRSKPDFVVRVPGQRQIVIDVKCSLDAYIGASAASEAGDEVLKDKLLEDHKRAIRAHAQSLMKRAYQDKFRNSATFVVMFVPGENFLHAAIQRDRNLLSDAQKGNVIIVGPTNLISLVLSVAALRDQARLAERAEHIGEIGKRLYENLATLGKNAHLMAGAVRSVVSNWNSLVGTLDGHMLSTARKFDELGVGKASPAVRELEPLEVPIREPQKLISVDGLARPNEANDDEEPPHVAAE